MKKSYLLSFSIGLMILISLNVNAQTRSFKYVAVNWLADNLTEYNLSHSDVDDLNVTDEYYSDGMNVTLLYLNQSYKGIKIHNAISTVAIRDSKVFNFANAFISGIEKKVNDNVPTVTPLQAIKNVANKYNLGQVLGVNQIEVIDNKYIFSKGNISGTDIHVELNYFLTTDDKLRLAWDLNIQALDNKNWYSVRIDALTGSVLDMNNWVISCSFGDHTEHTAHKETNEAVSDKVTFGLFKEESNSVALGAKYKVYALPTESPLFGDPTVVVDPENPIASPYGWHDTNGVPGAEYTITRGNNVWALDDRNGNNGEDGYSPDGGSTLDFTGYSTEIRTQPIIFQDLAITNLFYVNNMMHDIFYRYGFNEVAGNFQANNYGKGGAQGDFVYADAQDTNGAQLSNANFNATPDGFNGRMQMYLWKKAVTNQAQKPLKINSGSLAGSQWFAAKGDFGAPLTLPGITADLALVNDGVAPDVHDACEGAGTTDFTGKIAVVRRNECEFGLKAVNVQFSGAIAVVFLQNEGDTNLVSMQGGALGDLVNVPVVIIGKNDGDALLAALVAGENISATLFDDGPYNPDGDLDNGIIAHEYGHGVTVRLTGGPSTANCLKNETQMGEGWSDWMFYMLTMKDSDTSTKARGLANFPIFGGRESGGIRKYMYSSDFTINPFTYKDVADVSGVSKPHGIGTVWATILWDLSWMYDLKYGFDEDLFNGTSGNNKVIQLVIDAVKLQPCGPDFVQARDAILAADMATTGGADQCLIWDVFAKRGLGVGATAGLKTSRTDQVESFVRPDYTTPAYASCTALSVNDFNFKSAFKIFPNPTSDQLNIVTTKAFGKVQISISDINGRQIISKMDNLISNTSVNLSSLKSGMYILTIKGDDFSVNEKIIKQ